MSNGRMRTDFTPAGLFVGRPRDAWGKRIRTAAPSAREMFAELRPRLLASRPEIKTRVKYVDDQGKNRVRTVVTFGKPTFRNPIMDGEHV